MRKMTRQARLKTNSNTILSILDFFHLSNIISHKYYKFRSNKNLFSKTATPFEKIHDQRLRDIMRLPFLTNSVDISPQKLIIVLRDVPRETTVQDEHSGASRSNAFGAIARTIAMQSLGTGGCRWSWLLSQIDIYDTQPRSPQKKLWWVRWISVYPENFIYAIKKRHSSRALNVHGTMIMDPIEVCGFFPSFYERSGHFPLTTEKLHTLVLHRVRHIGRPKNG